MESAIAGVIRSLGASLKNRGLYPVTHPLVRNPVEKCHQELAPFFADRSELALAVSDGTLVLEGVPIFQLTSSLELFMARLGAIGLPAVIFERGVSVEDIELFVRFLHETKEQGLPIPEIKSRLARWGVTHIRVTSPEDEEKDDFTLAREVYGNALNVVVRALKDVRNGKTPDGAKADHAVREMSGMVSRNRDAMLALTLIKNFDEYTYNHSVNVSVLSLAVAETLGLDDSDRIGVGVAGLLHDVGKTQLALDLIRKPGTLTVEEFEEIKKHPDPRHLPGDQLPHLEPRPRRLLGRHRGFEFGSLVAGPLVLFAVGGEGSSVGRLGHLGFTCLVISPRRLPRTRRKGPPGRFRGGGASYRSAGESEEAQVSSFQFSQGRWRL